MYLFILGVILGMGLTLAVRSVAKTLQLRKIRKRIALEQEIEARIVARYDAWDAHEAYMRSGMTKVSVTPAPAPTW
jgi:hypothetical protein